MRASGFDVTTVVEIGLQGRTDLEIVAAAAERGLTIVTQDLDFGRIFVDRAPAVQIVVVRPRSPLPVALVPLIGLLGRLDLDGPRNRMALFVLSSRGVRVRHRGQ